jgi:long-chain fatty acid transport protein
MGQYDHVNLGTEYKWVGLTDNHAWDVAFRTGYIRSHSPVTDLNFDPAFADNDVHVATVGMGVFCRASGKFLGLIACADTEKSFLAKSSIGLDVFYQAFVFDTRTVTGSSNPTVCTYGTSYGIQSVVVKRPLSERDRHHGETA